MKRIPWRRYGSPQRMVTLNKSIFEKLGDYLTSTLKYDFNKVDGHYHYTTCIKTKNRITDEGFSLNFKQSEFVTEKQRKAIEGLFPVCIGNLRFKLLSVFDYDFDEEREWQPSIGFTVEEISLEPTKEDQIFIYWEQ
jgi:hypothetical protein